MCYLCNGASKDYRTVRAHADNYRAERPVYPEGHEENKEDHHDPVIQPNQPHPNVPDPPYEPASVEDIVSHVETLPNCNEPAYESVHTHDASSQHIALHREHTVININNALFMHYSCIIHE
jgi:hypothetical protein